MNTLSPDVCYRDDMLWLPKKTFPFNLTPIRNSLSYEREGLRGKKGPRIEAFEETADHLVLPRAYFTEAELEELPFRVEDRCPESFPQVRFNLRSALFPRQVPAWKAAVEGGSGVVNLRPGRGKTVIAIHTAWALGMPTLIVCHTLDLMKQWKERILEHTDVAEEDIGWVKGDEWDWEGKTFVICSLKTLVSRMNSSEVLLDIRLRYGLWIYDEVHHLAAETFNQTAHLCWGIRLGLTATAEREDGLEHLFFVHIGEILYSDLSHDLIPTTFFVQLPWRLDRGAKVYDRNQQVNYALLLNWLSAHEQRNAAIEEVLSDAVAEDRTIIVLSDRVDQLVEMHKKYEVLDGGAGLIVGDVHIDARPGQLRDWQLVFATTQLATEGLDRKELDTAFVLTPFASEVRLIQLLGRLQRICEGKQEAYAVVFEDVNIKSCRNMCRRLRAHLTGLDYPYNTITLKEYLHGE